MGTFIVDISMFLVFCEDIQTSGQGVTCASMAGSHSMLYSKPDTNLQFSLVLVLVVNMILCCDELTCVEHHHESNMVGITY